LHFLAFFAFFYIFPFLADFSAFLWLFCVFLRHYLAFYEVLQQYLEFYKIFFLREVLLFSVYNFVISCFSKDMKPWHLFCTHSFCGVNRCSLAWHSSSKAMLAIDLNQTSNPLQIVKLRPKTTIENRMYAVLYFHICAFVDLERTCIPIVDHLHSNFF